MFRIYYHPKNLIIIIEFQDYNQQMFFLQIFTVDTNNLQFIHYISIN